jgi:hypothetical protein
MFIPFLDLSIRSASNAVPSPSHAGESGWRGGDFGPRFGLVRVLFHFSEFGEGRENRPQLRCGNASILTQLAPANGVRKPIGDCIR